jgi:tripartite-type tricarboxylate transporter receptor subunit TctC
MRLLAFLLLALGAAPGWVFAQYPARAIHIVAPVPPSGAPDVAARVLGEKLSAQLGQPVVVDNRPGSNGNLAMDAVARAAPDGYTLGLFADSNITINPYVYRKLPFDTQRDLVPIASVASNQFVLAINPALPVKSFPEFVEYARAAKPPLAYASAGNGSQHHLTMEMLKTRAGIELLHVPYKGGAPATAATVAGETAAMWAGSSNSGQIRAGRLRPLAVSGGQRSVQYPELPTIAEFYPGFENSIWLGLFAPAGTPEPVLGRLREEVKRALELPEVKGRLNHAGGLEPHVTTHEEFLAIIRRDREKYAKVVKDLGIKIE